MSPTNLINNSEYKVVINQALVGVMIRFICENPRSASLEEIGIVPRAICKKAVHPEHFSQRDIHEIRELLFFRLNAIEVSNKPLYKNLYLALLF